MSFQPLYRGQPFCIWSAILRIPSASSARAIASGPASIGRKPAFATFAFGAPRLRDRGPLHPVGHVDDDLACQRVAELAEHHFDRGVRHREDDDLRFLGRFHSAAHRACACVLRFSLGVRGILRAQRH